MSSNYLTRTMIQFSQLASLITATEQLALLQSSALNKLRQDSAKQLKQLRLPTLADEDWRFSDVSKLKELDFYLNTKSNRSSQSIQELGVTQAQIENCYLVEAIKRLVFIDGVYQPQFSVTQSSDAKLLLGDFAQLGHSGEELLAKYLGPSVSGSADIFATLNGALLTGGAVIHLASGCAEKAPLQLLFISTGAAASLITPRVLIIAEAGSSLSVVEQHLALDVAAQHTPSYLSLPLSEIILAEHARLEHVRIQQEGAAAYHIGYGSVIQGQGSYYKLHSIDQGGLFARYNLKVTQKMAGAESQIAGLSIANKQQLVDMHSCIEHAASAGVSRQLHKCIVDDSAHAVFNGQIKVHAAAQQTNSHLANHNLLLSPRAQLDSKPQLEIFADDVCCTHGATVGQLSDEEVFYLQSRGVAEAAARKLLSYAFAAEIIAAMPHKSLKSQLQQMLLKQTEAVL